MRHLSLLAAVVTAALAFSTSAGAAQNVFVGTWQAIDVDGSLMTFTVTGSGDSARFVLHDHYATGCVEHFGASNGNAILTGTATISGYTLTWTVESFRCTNGIVRGSGGTFTFFYDPTTGTMFSTVASWGQVSTWYPMGAPLEAPTTP